jgi:hypothetical protein
MRPSRPLLPIRPLELPARLGRRQRRLAPVSPATEICTRFEQINLAIAQAARPVWLRGPLFQATRSSSFSANLRHAA